MGVITEWCNLILKVACILVLIGCSQGHPKKITLSRLSLSKSPCGNNGTVCEKPQGYPENYIRQLFTRIELPKYFREYTEFNVQHRAINHHPPRDIYVCSVNIAKHTPRSAENKEGDWMYVINQGKFVQEVHVEYCVEEMTPCSFVHVPFGYKAQCKQNYSFRKLYAINSTGDVILQDFMFPSHCSCDIITTMKP